MKFRSLLLPRRTVFGLLAVFGSLLVSSAKADSVTFATFAEKSTTNEFQYKTTGTAGAGGLATFDITGPSVGVNFRYVPATVFTAGLPAALLGNQDAHMKFVATSASAVTVFGGFAFQQNFTGYLEITRDTAFGGLSNLLRVDFTGTLLGLNGGSTSSLGADVALGDTVTYTSDFINFGALNTTNENTSLTYTSILPMFIKSAVTGFFVPFTAYGTGSFAAATAVPEPTTMAGALGGLALAGLAVIRRRSTKV